MKKTISIILAVIMVFSMLVVTTSAATSYETESNDTYSTADALALNSSISGIMNSGSDIDVYKVVAPSTGKLTLTFNHSYTDESYVIWEVSVYHYSNGSYNELSSKQINGRTEERINLPSIGTVSSGVYYIKVDTSTSWGNTTKYEYAIKNSFSSTNYYEKEMNNEYSTATSMSINNQYSGYMNNGSDIDVYKVVAPSTGKLTLTFNHPYTDESYVIWEVSVYYYSNGSYNELGSKQINGRTNGPQEITYIGATASRVYYIKVSTSTSWQNTTNHEYSIIADMPVTTYTISYNANGGTGAPASQTKTHGTALTLSSTKPTRTGYTFLGWSTSSTATSATYSAGGSFTTNANTTLYAVWQKNSSGSVNNFTFKIKDPSITTIRCNDGIVIHANVNGNLPKGATIEWTWNNGNFDVDIASDGSTCTIISINKGYTVFTATVYDVNGNKLASDTVEMYSKAGFFDKIGGFFRSLFGSDKIYEY